MVGEPVNFHLPLTGAFQVSNAVVALALAITTGATAEKAVEALEPPQGRARAGWNWLPSTMARRSSSTTRTSRWRLRPRSKRCVPTPKSACTLVFGAGGDRDKGKRPMMGEVAARLADVVIVTDDNPRTEDAATIRSEILAAVPKAREIGDRRLAIETAISELKPGDVLLIAGKGHEDYQIVGTTKHHFSDHEVVLETLKRK